MKDDPLVFISHPVRPRAAGEKIREANLNDAALWLRWANKHTDALAVAPYLGLCRALNDGDLLERSKGVAVSVRVLRCCDELWLCGSHISGGMWVERQLAREWGIPVVDLTQKEWL